jgi:hypothetical protein
MAIDRRVDDSFHDDVRAAVVEIGEEYEDERAPLSSCELALLKEFLNIVIGKGG